MTEASEFPFEMALQEHSFAIHFQPRISSQSSSITGLDIHLRHQKDESGPWQDASFYNNASFVQLNALWQWKLDQLEQVIHKLKERDARLFLERPYFRLSLRLISTQLRSDAWAVQLMDAVDRFDVPGECIEIVLTGKTDLLDRSLLELNFEHVRHAGISITLDDFPVAESSFLQLAEYKFDKVKFSKALMPSLSDSVAIWSKKRELLNILAAAAKSIGVSVVLTGVDREAHFNFFRELAVDEWQGRYFGDVGQLSDMDTRINATHFL